MYSFCRNLGRFPTLTFIIYLPLQLEDFLPVMKLYDLLYPETEPLPLPNINSSSCTFKMAVTSIWIHLSKKAQNERLQRPIPHALSTHIEYEHSFPYFSVVQWWLGLHRIWLFQIRLKPNLAKFRNSNSAEAEAEFGWNLFSGHRTIR